MINAIEDETPTHWNELSSDELQIIYALVAISNKYSMILLRNFFSKMQNAHPIVCFIVAVQRKAKVKSVLILVHTSVFYQILNKMQ